MHRIWLLLGALLLCAALGLNTVATVVLGVMIQVLVLGLDDDARHDQSSG